MIIENDRRLSDLLEDAFMDIAGRISAVLDMEFDRRCEGALPPTYFNAGYSYTDFLGKILSNEFGDLSDKDVKLADKIIDREFKKLNSSESFVVRMYAIEYGSKWQGSVKDARIHVLHHWKQTLLARFMYNDNPDLYEFPITPVVTRPVTCPYCGGKVVEVCYEDPTQEIMEKADKGELVLATCYDKDYSPDWQCINCGSDFKQKEDIR